MSQTRRLTLLLALLVPSTASARRVFTVDPNGEFPTLTSALAVATSGDRLQVLSGTYSECLALTDMDIEIVGSGSGNATIDCAGGATFAIDAANSAVQLVGLTIRNDTSQGVRISGGSLVGKDLVLSGLGTQTSGVHGGALQVTGARVHLTSATFANNAAAQGGAIWASDDALVHLFDSSLTANSAEYGGAIYLDRAKSTVRNSTFNQNTATEDGGSAYVFSDTDPSTLTDETWPQIGVLFLDDAVGLGGSARRGGYVATSGQGTVFAAMDSTLQGGAASGVGGAIYSEGWQVSLLNSVINQNTAQGGGGIYGDGSEFYARGSDLTNNTATSFGGGAIWWPGSNAWDAGNEPRIGLEGGVVSGNTAAGDGGAIRTSAQIDARGITFRSNTGENGGAIYQGGTAGTTVYSSVEDSLFDQNTATDTGGGIYVGPLGIVTLTDNRFNGNDAVTGGAVSFTGTGDGNPVNHWRNQWSGNTATTGGAVALNARATTFVLNQFSNNSATGDGGAIYATNGITLTVEQTEFYNNSAINDGGGLYLGTTGQGDLTEVVFASNSATRGGGAATQGALMRTTHSWFCENTASGAGSALYAAYINALYQVLHSGFAENSGEGAVVFDGYGGIARGGEQASVSTSSFAGNGIGLVTYGAPSTGGVTYVSSSNSAYAAHDIALYTADSSSDAVWSYSSLFQDNTTNASPGPLNSGNFELDGLTDALYPSYSPGTGCAADLTVNRVYRTVPYPTPSLSADQLFADADNDGWTIAEGDCDDNQSSVNPGATEIASDGYDQNCDGIDDDDFDGDGVGDAEDCASSDRTIPAASEVWYNDVDNDCSGITDFDQDSDRWELDHVNNNGSNAPFLLDIGDCNDTDATAFPGAVETWYDAKDNDCDGRNDYDRDFDGYVRSGFDVQAGGTAPNQGDCDDARGDVYPGAPDAWYDGVDANCSGNNDFDKDGDGYIAVGYEGNEGNLGTGDCNDENGAIHPGATEILDNEIDDNCDGFTDIDATTDSDSDGIPDVYEVQYGTDPNDTDSDDDGIDDGVEWHDGCDTYTLADEPADSDGDGDYDAMDDDSDDDGITDATEGTDNSDDDCLEDFRDADDDGDTLPTADEIANGTDPLDPDSDNDSVPDAIDLAPLSDGTTEAVAPDGIEDYGCGCSTTRAPAPFLVFLTPLLALRRRR